MAIRVFFKASDDLTGCQEVGEPVAFDYFFSFGNSPAAKGRFAHELMLRLRDRAARIQGTNAVVVSTMYIRDAGDSPDSFYGSFIPVHCPASLQSKTAILKQSSSLSVRPLPSKDNIPASCSPITKIGIDSEKYLEAFAAGLGGTHYWRAPPLASAWIYRCPAH